MSSFLGKVLFVILVSMLCIANSRAQSSYDLRSPDGQVELRIRTSDRLRYDVLLKGNALLENCTFSLDVEHKKLGLQPKVLDANQRSNNEVIKPVIRQKFAQLHDNYNEVRLTVDGGYA